MSPACFIADYCPGKQSLRLRRAGASFSGVRVMRYPWQKFSPVGALAAFSLTVFSGSGAGVALAAGGATAAVDSTRLDHADQDAGNWLTYGRTYSEQRYSPLTRI